MDGCKLEDGGRFVRKSHVVRFFASSLTVTLLCSVPALAAHALPPDQDVVPPNKHEPVADRSMPPSHRHARTHPPTGAGVWLHGSGGFLLSHFGDIRQDLAAPTALGPGAGRPAYGGTVSGGVRLLVGQWFIGFKGMGARAPEVFGPHGSARVGFAVGGAEIGIVSSWKRNMVYPFFGVFGGSQRLRMQSNGTPITFGASDPIARRARFHSDVVLLELGLGGGRFWTFEQTHARFNATVGLELAAMFAVAQSEWLDSRDREVGGVGSPRLQGGMVRLSIGAQLVSTHRRPSNVRVAGGPS